MVGERGREGQRRRERGKDRGGERGREGQRREREREGRTEVEDGRGSTRSPVAS